MVPSFGGADCSTVLRSLVGLLALGLHTRKTEVKPFRRPSPLASHGTFPQGVSGVGGGAKRGGGREGGGGGTWACETQAEPRDRTGGRKLLMRSPQVVVAVAVAVVVVAVVVKKAFFFL